MADTQTTQSVNAAALAAVFRNEAPRMTALAARLLRESEIPECVVGAEETWCRPRLRGSWVYRTS
ncbi:hypothetical protein [Streptomyces massasporeus]|uniref:hypothetical protein n=1 Tax=Streptomyces massasporeus TaxID=67324 RepID=UPI0033DE79F8